MCDIPGAKEFRGGVGRVVGARETPGLDAWREGNVPNLPLCFYNHLFPQVRVAQIFAAKALFVESGRFGTSATRKDPGRRAPAQPPEP